MPVYNFKNDDTGDMVEVAMSYDDIDQWKKDNPGFRRYYGTDSFPAMVRENGDILSKVPDGFKDKLNQIKKGSGRGNTIKTA